ncbi:MAG: rRNA maturation RNase YbeY [Candidatus Taylorbacteria bacterium RIFCSPLOWO2_01_FULL_44_26]|uniref:Endoribonuclease YbeY n=2 Tax=Candidatus Tayloriibacteriota TaxID=1817919 RepID=A0A1G2MJU0_9BACT|nr:MAG: rRNA maturation RNase YbeY [Candidatus Taylorbacteria bacterium RIFCSPHIGHO2_02_FULL_44_12]OHA30961.1 MAG: rRNA maturation RNase YbeY [Candidatus Taylorbacteria bacterium RIFCSPLOWO2_01_FULL_44_26]
MLTVANQTRSVIPKIKFQEIKKLTLGDDYNLNLVFIPSSRISKLNKIYRGKDHPTDILSFPISNNQGEIYLCLSEARKEARKFARSYDNFIAFLFIHGCTHLKGYDHGSTMENIEVNLRKKFSI